MFRFVKNCYVTQCPDVDDNVVRTEVVDIVDGIKSISIVNKEVSIPISPEDYCLEKLLSSGVPLDYVSPTAIVPSEVSPDVVQSFVDGIVED